MIGWFVCPTVSRVTTSKAAGRKRLYLYFVKKIKEGFAEIYSQCGKVVLYSLCCWVVQCGLVRNYMTFLCTTNSGTINSKT